jgi:hypothetical protein
MTMSPRNQSDADLLRNAESDPAGFGLFYRRYERLVLGFLMRATNRSDLALDLAAETAPEEFRRQPPKASIAMFHPCAPCAPSPMGC